MFHKLPITYDQPKSLLIHYSKALLQQICLDGKKLKAVSPTSKGTDGLWIVNAWVSENRLCIGQQRVETKTNEIDVINPLLQQLDITDAIVTIDAMGCPTAIAQQIVDQKGHYLLALKSNQEGL